MITFWKWINGAKHFQYSIKYREISPPRIVEQLDVPIVLVVEKVQTLLRQLFALDVCQNGYFAFFIGYCFREC